MKESASIMSDDLQQMTDLLLVVELREGRLKYAVVKTSRTNHHLLNHPSENDSQYTRTQGRVASTDLVSPSRSLSLLFSGWIFLVSILG
jgi:hypothetical protein